MNAADVLAVAILSAAWLADRISERIAADRAQRRAHERAMAKLAPKGEQQP